MPTAQVMSRFALLIVLVACRAERPEGPAPRSPTPAYTRDVVTSEVVATGLEHPWAIAIMSDGRMLVTERPGRLRVVSREGALSPPITGVPVVWAHGQGGLLDVALDPQFDTNHIIYLSYAEAAEDGKAAGTAVARAVFAESTLTNVRVIYRQDPKVVSDAHFGSRIAFRRDGTMFITQGERYSFRSRAQDLDTDLGKVVRLNRDGSIPRDNPFVGRSDVLPEIWSYGHRNVQAAAVDPLTDQLWTVEHGAMGGDELNHPEAGKNYGWPVITYGLDYNGRSIGTGAVKDGMEQPVYYWDPVIAPSGMAFYESDRIPGWKGSILIGGLASDALVRLELANGKVVREERYLGELHERIRDVQVSADGSIYVVTDSDAGRILRVVPMVKPR